MIGIERALEFGKVLGFKIYAHGRPNILLTPTEANCLKTFCENAEGPYDNISFCRGLGRTVEFAAAGPDGWTVLFKDVPGLWLSTEELRDFGRGLQTLIETPQP